MNRSGIFWGVAIIIVGVVLLAGGVFDVSLARYLWPLAFIGLGLWLLLGQRRQLEMEPAVDGFISEVKRDGRWEVIPASYRAFISDMKLDMTQAEIPDGETVLYFSGFIGDIKLRVPDDVGVKISVSAFIGETKVLGETRSGFLSPLTLQTADYKLAARRLHIQTNYFISDVKVWAGENNVVEVGKPAQA